MEVTAPGFERLLRSGVMVVTGQTVVANLSLRVGSEAQTVSVDADAPLLQQATSNIETNIPGRTVIAEPLNSRNFVQLAALTPGVELPPGTVLPRINGGRPRTNEYLYDGISALQPEPGQVVFFPIIDDIAEFTVESNNVPAEFGRFNGGVINVATRSGSNAFHGSLYEFFRNEDLNTRNYFSAAGRKPEYRRNLYGGTVGLPIPHDRMFFFGGYQGLKQAIGRTVISTVPTVAERQGIFTGVSRIYNPGSTRTVNGRYIRTVFLNDAINTAVTPLDPAAVALLARIPLPTASGAANNYSRTANDSDHQNQFDARVDAAPSPRDRVFGRYSYYAEVDQPISFLPDGSGPAVTGVIGTNNVAGLTHVLGQQAVVGETHTFTAAAAVRRQAGIHAAVEQSSGAAAGEHGFGGAGHSGDTEQCGVFKRAADLHVYGISADRAGGEYVQPVPDGGLGDGGLGGVDAGATFVEGRCGLPDVSVECGITAQPDGLVCVHDDGYGYANGDGERGGGRQCVREFSFRAGGYVFNRSAKHLFASARSHSRLFFAG